MAMVMMRTPAYQAVMPKRTLKRKGTRRRSMFCERSSGSSLLVTVAFWVELTAYEARNRFRELFEPLAVDRWTPALVGGCRLPLQEHWIRRKSLRPTRVA